MDQITNSFYVAAIQYSSLTGYSSSMSDADFVTIIYKNVLGRTGPTAPTETEVHYWADQITSGALSRYGVTASMLNAAHAYAGDPVWGWVPQLLDNRFSVATLFCLEQGLNYNTPEESITKGMAIAAAVTSSSIADAVNLIGITDTGFNLTLVTDSKAGSFGSIAYGNNLYVSIFQNSFSTSTDGQTWSGPIPGVDWKFSKVIWDKTQFVAIGEKGMTATSADGLQWTLRKTATDYDLLYVERVNDVLIATGMPPFFAFYPPMLQSVTLTSSDGVTWSVQAANINARHFAFGAGTLVVLNTYTDSSSEIYRSFDGVNWIPGTLPPISDMPAGAIHRFLTKIAYGNGQFVVIVEFRGGLA
ncbi:MAG: DUF4214 domain-containing protein, partial [Ignavibacteria bacterium]|nr:DUF4214 domain-containing protein [Ignavibacteria bacterium]